jgi:hypothetical protein
MAEHGEQERPRQIANSKAALIGHRGVLRAAKAAGVERVVQTSSMATVEYGHPHDRTAPLTEADWTVVDAPGLTPYAKSKTLAERAARDWMTDIAHAIRSQLGEAARKVPSRVLPDWLVKLIGLFDPAARQIVSRLGLEVLVDNTLTRDALQMTFIPANDSAAAMARSLIELKAV